MGHKLDFSTGNAAMAFVGETPWHRLGQALSPNQTIEEWLRAARLEWKLEPLPLQYFWDGNLRTVDGRIALVRSDTGEALSVVSNDYNIVQPGEVLEFYRDLVTLCG